MSTLRHKQYKAISNTEHYTTSKTWKVNEYPETQAVQSYQQPWALHNLQDMESEWVPWDTSSTKLSATLSITQPPRHGMWMSTLRHKQYESISQTGEVNS